MKTLGFFSFLILVFCCAPADKKDLALADSTHSVATNTSSPAIITEPLAIEVSETKLNGGLTIKGEDTIMTVENQWAFVSDPYDFSLDVFTIQNLLSGGAQVKEEKFEDSETGQPYAYFTMTYVDTISFKESEIRFYDYPGKHFSTIATPLLPLKRGILIGMSKQSFLEAMNFSGDSIMHANVFSLTDSYGSLDFRFRADTLNLISAYWEEGD